MKNESFDTTPPYGANSELVNSQSYLGDLPELIEKMKLSHDWTNGELFAKILLKSPQKRVMLTVLHEGTEITSFQSNDSVTFQIIEGKLMFQSREKLVILQKGQYLTLREKISYSLTTAEDTAFLLTIALGDLNGAEKLHQRN